MLIIKYYFKFVLTYRSQRIGIIGTIMLTKHMVLLSPDEESISIDKSSEDILLTKKAKTAYSLIGNLLYGLHWF